MTSLVQPPPWWESLDFLAPDTRADFGRLVTLLERGLGAAGPSVRPEDPAGWAGIARRGSWDRLVPSEWALLEAAPEEFARRADEGELGFWETAHDGQERSRSVWVWLDAGPDQLGACRVVQIALLLWLQRLCRRTGGEFYWGVIQSPDTGYEQLGAEELKTFLSLRSTDPPRRPPERMDGTVTWCVGSEGWMSQIPASFQRVTLSQNGPGSVELRTTGRRLDLPLPAEERAVRLLRDPMVWKVARRSNARPGGAASPASRKGVEDYAFSRCGKKLLLAYSDQIVVAPIPSSSREEPGKTRAYPLRFSGPVLAVSMEDRAIRVVQQHDGDWVFYRLNPARSDLDEMLRVPADDTDAMWLGTCWRSGDSWHLWLEDEYWKSKDNELIFIGLVQGGSALGGASLLLFPGGRVQDSAGQTVFTLPHQSKGPLLLARTDVHQVEQTGYAIAYPPAFPDWIVLWQDREQVYRGSGSVLGLVCEDHYGPALVIEEEGQIRLQGTDWSEQLDIKPGYRRRFHPNGLLVYTGDEGDLVVYGFADRSVRWSRWSHER